MRQIFLLTVLVAVVASKSISDDWEHFKTQYGKSYLSHLEETYRKGIFLDNQKMIDEHNAKFAKGESTYEMGMNRFGDLTTREFAEMYNGLVANNTASKNDAPVHVNSGKCNKQLVDWRKEGALTEVKDQANCGSCWAFSATASLEAYNYFKTGKLISLSEQNLMDCSRGYGNHACLGGLMTNAFAYVTDNKGIDTEESYPYQAFGWFCRYKEENKGGTCNGYTEIPEGDEHSLQDAACAEGPVSVGIDADHDSFKHYKSGVYYEPECGNTKDDLDHGVTVIGFGAEDGKDYWLVRNSWGTDWGDNGHIKMSRFRDNNCGISTMASYPNVL